MARAVNLIVSCTNRKRFEVLPETAVHDVGGRDLETRLKLWKANLRNATAAEHPADNVYIGDHWSIVHAIPTEARQLGLGVKLWVCSAGYGLIRPETPIKAYRATFTRGENDYVASGLIEDQNTLHRWWKGVCSYRFSSQHMAARTISEMAAAFPRTPLVVALSADYLKAVAEDLAAVLVRPYFQDHLSIVSCGTPQPHPIWKHNLLPCDGSLASSLGGTLTSLNARVARRLLYSLDGTEPTVWRLTQLAHSINLCPRTTTPARVPTSDADVARFIQSHLTASPMTSKTRLLREFRGNGLACEQKRFGELYSKVRSRLLAGAYA